MLRICLAGQVAVEVDGGAVATTGLGPLGRLALAYLVTERGRSVERHELAELLWGENPPASWETSLRVLVSKLRGVLERAGLPAREVLAARFGCYQLCLPGDASLDVEEAEGALACSLAAMAEGNPAEALRNAACSVDIAGRQFLPGATGPWVERRQAALREVHLQALEAMAAAASACGEWSAAARAAEDAISREPLREQLWIQLMAAHSGAGNRAEALRTYERCRRLLVEELGVSPSPPTEAAYIALLADSARPPPTLAPSDDSVPPADAPSDDSVPPADAPSSLAGHCRIPLPLTTFVGRDDELAEVAALVGRSRLVTLTGAGGVGKTRLAVEAARALEEEFGGGSVFVELDRLADPRLVDAHVLSASGGVEEPGRTPLGTLVARFGDLPVLLVLDNCEHVLSAVARVAETLLSRCPGLKVLATSREPLRVPSESALRVRSLSFPHPDHHHEPATILGYEAVRLLVERSTASSSDFTLTDANAAAAARICAELDGIPLALELAASRTGGLSLEEIAKRLDDRFPLLTTGSRTAPPRHRTLRGAVDWTYDVLSAEQQDALHRVSVFAGGFTLEAARSMWPDDRESSVLDRVTGLVECSLVIADTGAATTRYRLPETIRQYAAAKLVATGEGGQARLHHLRWATDLARQPEEGHLGGDGEAAWLKVLDAELDNLRAALTWATTRDAPAGGALALVALLGRFWEVRGHLREGRRWLVAALEMPGPPESDPDRACALNWAGILAQRQGDSEAAQLYYQDSLAIMRENGDMAGIAAALHGLGNLSALQGEDAARFFFEESLTIGRDLGDDPTVAASLANLGWIAHNDGDLAAAEDHYGLSLGLRRKLGDRHGEAMLLGNLGYLAFQRGDHETAQRLDDDSLSLRQELGDRHGEAMVLGNLGHLAFHQGDDERARVLYRQSLSLRQELGDRHGEAGSLANLAAMARVEGDGAGARYLYESALSIARDLGDRYRTAWLLVQLGRLAASEGDLAGARALYREALPEGSDFLPLATAAEWLEAMAAAVVAGPSTKAPDAERAALLLGAASALRRDMGLPVAPRDAPELDRTTAAVRDALEPAAFDSAWSAGLAMSAREAVALGQAESEQVEPVRAHSEQAGSEQVESEQVDR